MRNKRSAFCYLDLAKVKQNEDFSPIDSGLRITPTREFVLM